MTLRFNIWLSAGLELTTVILMSGCTSQFIPELSENEEVLVVDGLITNQPGPYIIKISRTLPIWTRDFMTPLDSCRVWISDDLGNIDSLQEEINKTGTFHTVSDGFAGTPGRTYTLHIRAWTKEGYRNYESIPMKMIPVPGIDSIYYEKRDFVILHLPTEGCQIFLDTHDPSGSCKFYRWNYSETWEIRLPFEVPNRICWVTEKSKEILIKNTGLLSENTVRRLPLKLIKNPVDRLDVKYSILVNQFSMNEEEFIYWLKLKNCTEQVGGLFDVVPSTITGNLFCVEDPLEKVLGYFSVSAVSSKRYFIQEKFIGVNRLYADCYEDVVYGTNPVIPDLGLKRWIINDFRDSIPPRMVLTSRKGCWDCTDRGTNVKPDYWDNEK